METTNAPYYIIPDIEALGTEKDAEKLRKLRRRIAANIGNPDALRALLGDSNEDFNDFYGSSELPNLSTEDTIDSFLEKFGGDSPHTPPMETSTPAAIQQVPIAPAYDYAMMMESEASSDSEEESSSSPDSTPADDTTLGVIDTFLSKTPPPRIRPKKEEKTEEKPSLSESFAKIMIKNGNYQRALEIITQISLKNPEKSIYFADQIRFLQKLTLIESQKSKN